MTIPPFASGPDAVAFTNCKSFGDAGAHLALQAAQNYGSHNNRINVMTESVAGGFANQMLTPDPVESIATVQMMTGRESQNIAEAIGLAQQLIKIAQTTPPPTTASGVVPPA